MRIQGRKFAITGAGRGLGAALATVMADQGAKPILLARSDSALSKTASDILARTGQTVPVLVCDLADPACCIEAGEKLTRDHPDLDGIIHNGAMWLPGRMDGLRDADIQACIGSAATGALILTRHLLPNLRSREFGDIFTIVSTSALPNRPLGGGSVAFTAAKFAQSGFVHGLSEELSDTNIRVGAVYPDNIEDISPLDMDWQTPTKNGGLSNREVVDAVLFALNLPHGVSVKSLVIE